MSTQLDVYYPIAPSTSGKTQILVWVYGGGFITGARQMPAPMDLGYACVGAYFARRGFIVLSMPIGTEEIERFIVVFGRFLERYADILRTGQAIAH